MHSPLIYVVDIIHVWALYDFISIEPKICFLMKMSFFVVQ